MPSLPSVSWVYTKIVSMFIITHHYITKPDDHKTTEVPKDTEEGAIKYFRNVYPINPIISIKPKN